MQKNFRGCFKEVGQVMSGGRLEVGGSILMSAPNRYRKMIDTKNQGWVSSWNGGSFDNETVISRQAAEFPYPNPTGFEFDLFDCYITWQV